MLSEVAERLVERPQKQAPAAGQASVGRLGGLSRPDAARVDLGHVRGLASEVVPANGALVGQVPDALFLVEQQVQRRVNEVRYVGRRDDGLVAGDDVLAALQALDRIIEEIVAVPRAEKSAGPDDQRVRVYRQQSCL